MYLHKEYHRIGEQEIKFSISFNKETRSWATGQAKKIGYQVTATPVKRSQREGGITIEEFGAFTGFNDCLMEIDRQSSKRKLTAIQVLKQRLPEYLQWFENKLKTNTLEV